MSPTPASYDLKSVSLPRLAGGGLAAFVALVENPVTRPLLMGNLFETGGINKLRTLTVDEPPTNFPLVTPESREATPAPDPEAIAQSYSPTKGYTYPSIRDYAEAYRSGRATPEDVARRVLAAIKDSDAQTPPLRAFIAVKDEDVLAQARASAQRHKEGKPLSIFDGVPVAIKDEVDMVPYPTTVGTSFLGQAPAQEDATVVARLRAAGALLIGKTNMHEIGINPMGFNGHHGTVRNPYDPGRYSGGSSSGSAAAVAAGLCPVAIGADGGGSIRIPSALCGLVGLKATFGRVSERGAFPLCWSVAHLGPLATNTTDCALTYALVAGTDPLDANSLVQPSVTLDGFANTDLHGLRLGVYWPWFNHATPEIVAACSAALKTLESMGATIREVDIPDLDAQRISHAVTILSEMAAAMDAYAAHNGEHSQEVRINLALGRACTSRDYVQAQRVRTQAMRHFADALAQADVIVTPTTAITAPPLRPDALLPGGESDLTTVIELMRFVIPGNFTGIPALTVPVGYDSNGLPIGLQVMGKHWNEAKLLQIAHALESSIEKRAPRVKYKILEN